RRLLVLVFHPRRRRGRGQLALAGDARGPVRPVAPRERHARAHLGLAPSERRRWRNGVLRPVHPGDHGVVRLGALVEVCPHVLQAGCGVRKEGLERERHEGEPTRARRQARAVRQRAYRAAPLLREKNAYLRLHDPLRRLRPLRRHLPLRHHAPRQDLPARLQHRAEHVLGVLLVRQGLPAERDRHARLCRLCAAGPQRSRPARRKERHDRLEDQVPQRHGKELPVAHHHQALGPGDSQARGGSRTQQGNARRPAPLQRAEVHPHGRRRPAYARGRGSQAEKRRLLLMAYETIVEDGIDVLVVGAGLGGSGAAWEARFWGQDKKIVIAEKANIDRSGAVAQGLYAINCYMGTRWGENKPEDHVRYARIDLMGLVREDLLFDMARHVDSTVHQFEEWGLPIMKDPKTGRYLREGRWQIMIHGESYKPIVAEAAKKSADKVFNRVCVTHLLMDESNPNRVAGAVGFNVRTGNYHVFKSKTVICGAGGASNIFKPRSTGEGAGRTWYAPWSSASAYGLMIEAGAKMTQMENRIVLARFKDGYGPVGAYVLHWKN